MNRRSLQRRFAQCDADLDRCTAVQCDVRTRGSVADDNRLAVEAARVGACRRRRIVARRRKERRAENGDAQETVQYVLSRMSNGEHEVSVC
jgi:hypothetical protein